MCLAPLPYPHDHRVGKEAIVLADAGHEVLLACKRRDGEAVDEQIGPVRALRHQVHPGSSLRRRIDSATYLTTLDSPSWRGAFERLVTEQGAEVLHVHDLPYAKSGIAAARRTGVPVVLDLHENHPAAYRLWKRRPIDRTLFSADRAERLEKWAVNEADRVVVVVEEAAERLIAQHGCDPDKITVFNNVEPLSMLEPGDRPTIAEGELHLIYIGGIAEHRGLDTPVAAMPEILKRVPGARLTIIGDGFTLPALREQAAALGLAEPQVTFTGWMKFADAMEITKTGTVGLVPHIRSPHTDATVPHKLFEYLSFGQPVIVSDCPPLARIVREFDAGEVFIASNASSFAEAAVRLSEASRWRATSDNGKRAIRDRYNLEYEGRTLAAMYGSLTGAGR